MYITLLMLILAYFLLKEHWPRAMGRLRRTVHPQAQSRERPAEQQDGYG